MIPPIQNLQAPYVVIKMVTDFQGLNLPPLESSFYYGIIEQTNYATIGFQTGDIVLFQKLPVNASFFNNGTQYYLVSETNIFYIAMQTATKIFDYTFDYTFE